MRTFATTVLALSVLFLTATAAPATAQGPEAKPKAKTEEAALATPSDWSRILTIYKQFQGGAKRFEAVRTISFDFTPAIYDEDGKQVFANTRHVTYLLRPDEDEQEARTMRIETEVLVPGEEGEQSTKTVSIVTAEAVNVWSQSKDGSFQPVKAKELQTSAVNDAQGLWAQLDLLLFPDNRDLRCKASGFLTRDAKRYASVEAEFHPRRATHDPVRLYFNIESTLIDRIDLFDPLSRLRKATIFLEQYQDHGGIQFPNYHRSVDRAGKPLGSWTFDKVQFNPKLTESHFQKP